MNLGRVLEDKGQYENALISLKKGLAIREQVLEPGNPDIVSALAWIGVSQNTGSSWLYSMILVTVPRGD